MEYASHPRAAPRLRHRISRALHALLPAFLQRHLPRRRGLLHLLCRRVEPGELVVGSDLRPAAADDLRGGASGTDRAGDLFRRYSALCAVLYFDDLPALRSAAALFSRPDCRLGNGALRPDAEDHPALRHGPAGKRPGFLSGPGALSALPLSGRPAPAALPWRCAAFMCLPITAR